MGATASKNKVSTVTRQEKASLSETRCKKRFRRLARPTALGALYTTVISSSKQASTAKAVTSLPPSLRSTDLEKTWEAWSAQILRRAHKPMSHITARSYRAQTTPHHPQRRLCPPADVTIPFI